jgi:hypothetical protein
VTMLLSRHWPLIVLVGMVLLFVVSAIGNLVMDEMERSDDE